MIVSSGTPNLNTAARINTVDSATYVLAMLTSQGAHDPPLARKMAWGLALGVLGAAGVLTGNISVIRAASSLGAIPYTLVLLLHVVAVLTALAADHRRGKEAKTK